MLWPVGMWLVVMKNTWFCRLCQVDAAFHAEIYARLVLELALPAFHGFPRQAVERGLVEFLNSEETQHHGMNDHYRYPPGNPNLV